MTEDDSHMCQLGVWELDRRTLLDRPDNAERAPTAPASALRALIKEPQRIGSIPEHGWRLLVDNSDVVAFGHRRGDETWVVGFEKRGDSWHFKGSFHHTEPRQTAAQKGRGLRLVWEVDEVDVVVGEPLSLHVLLVNQRKAAWSEIGPTYLPGWVQRSGTGESISPSHWYVTLAGREYHLGAGERAPIPVVPALHHGKPLAAGDYEMTVGIWEWALRSSPLRLLVRAS